MCAFQDSVTSTFTTTVGQETTQGNARGARAGANVVTGAEISTHLCDVAAEAVVANGLAMRCTMVNKDVRRMHAEPQPDGSPADMDARADIALFEVSGHSKFYMA